MRRSNRVWRILAVVLWVLSVVLLSGCGRARGRVVARSLSPAAQTATALQALASSLTTTPDPVLPATATLRPTATLPPTATATPTPTATATATNTNTPTVTPTATRTPSLLEVTDNILVLGVDHRTGDPDPSWRTDTIMVVAVDYEQDRVGIVSVPRDLYVDIPGLGEDRINKADFFGERTGYPGGGPALLRRVLTETLGIPSQHYARIQMEGLVQLVDALGGVTVTLDCPLYERVPDASSPNGVADWTLPAGEVHLDGETAKKFATYRYVTADFGRARRQQQLIWAIRDRALQLDVIPRIPELWKALSNTFQTDLGLVDVVRLAGLGARLKGDQVHSLVIDRGVLSPMITDDGQWVLVIEDRERLRAELDEIFTSRPVSNLGHITPGNGCPWTPTPVPTFTPTPEVTQTPMP